MAEQMNESTRVTGFTLWRRPRRGYPWKAVASGATEAELTQHYGRHGQHNEYLTLPSGEHPDELQQRISNRSIVYHKRI